MEPIAVRPGPELDHVKAVWEVPDVRSLESPDIDGGPFPSFNETDHFGSSPYGDS